MRKSPYDQAPQFSKLGWAILLGIALTVIFAVIQGAKNDPSPAPTPSSSTTEEAR